MVQRGGIMQVQDRYRWEAEFEDGSIVTKGGNIAGCIRFSLIPQDGTGLPRHDFTCLDIESRHLSVFNKIKFVGKETLPGRIYWSNGDTIQRTSEDMTGVLEKGNYIGKGVAGEKWYLITMVEPDHIKLLTPYSGKTKLKGLPPRRLSTDAMAQKIHCFHCLTCKDFRLWVNHSTGTVVTTQKNYQLNL